MSVRVQTTALVAVALLMSGCGGGPTPDPGTPRTGQPTALTVLAASSLTEAFRAIGKAYQGDHPGTTVTFSFGSSSTLAAQIVQGAPADVFAAANEETMRTATTAGAAHEPEIFATNVLEIAVPPGNPAGISGLADFSEEPLKIGLCAPQVPCGAAAGKVLQRAGVTPRPDTLESDVKALLQKVVLDEVDAALVYHTDVVAAGDTVGSITFAEAASVVNRYPVAAVTASRDHAAATDFVEYVLAADAQAMLRKAGFGAP